MCGIFAILSSDPKLDPSDFATKVASAASKLQHRGPDWSAAHCFDLDVKLDDASFMPLQFGIAHERLQIIDPYGGEQPIFDRQKKRVLAVNGEIYNHQELMHTSQLSPFKNDMTTKSDCEVIIPLWKAYGDPIAVNQQIVGVFAYILWDSQRRVFLISRDAIGVNPLYLGYRQLDGALFISSEIKALQAANLSVSDFREFPAGHYLLYQPDRSELRQSLSTSEFNKWCQMHIKPWYTPKWQKYSTDFMQVANQELLLGQIRGGLSMAVERRLMSDAPFGFLLSGGLDSSLVCSIAARLIKKLAKSHPKKYLPVINTYSIGQSGSPDLAAAQKVADYLGTNHHGFEFTIEQGLAAIPQVIYHIETFDVTTIRAGTPMFLLSRRIKAMGTKMVLSGEGADELFGGYLYFHQAPNAKEFYDETVDKMMQLSQYDCRRANKSTAAWGVEVRVPFLDRDFIDFVMSIPPEYKMIDPERGQTMEKWILRKAFEGYLPDEILWRQKEQFSDGVGYSWIDGLKAHAGNMISDTVLEQAHVDFPQKTPMTKEAMYFRQIFEDKLPHQASKTIVPWSKSVACSTPRALKWREEWSEMDEPSGRAVAVHNDKYD